jgi:F0F1-type ATP synthase epsilon subunit
MNKLLFPAGGMFFEGEDFEYAYQGLMEAMSGLISPFSSGNCIISGCDIDYTNGLLSISQGFAYIQGEVCAVVAQSINTQSLSEASLRIVETYDSNGLEVFADSVSRNTYAVRKAVLSVAQNDEQEVVLNNPHRIYYQKSFQSSDLNGDWQVVDGYSLKATLFNGRVFWSGRITGALSTVDVFAQNQLPLAFVPVGEVRSILAFGLNKVINFIVQSDALNGRVLVTDIDGSQVDFTGLNNLILDNVSYSI